MKQMCKYHPGESASWYCAGDGILFCDDCVALQGEQDAHALCFICNQPLEPVTAARGEPFWHILGHFVRYPLAIPMLVTALVTALAAALVPRDLVGLGIVILAGLPAGKLGHHALSATIEGRMTPPSLAVLGRPAGWNVAVMQWLLFALVCTGLGAAWLYLGMIAGVVLALLAWCLLPAMLIALQDEGRPAAVLDMRGLLSVVLGINVSYFVAVAVLFAGFLVASALASVSVDLLPALFGWSVASLPVLWLWFLTVHLMGYLGYQNADALGLGTRRRSARRGPGRSEEERRQAVLVKAGQYDRVVKQQRKLLDKNADSLQHHDDYFRLLNTLNERQALLDHAGDYLNLLLQHDQQYRLPGLLDFYRTLDKNFKPDTPQLSWDLARALAEQGHYKQAVQMLQDLHNRAPTWSGVADAYLFVARILVEQFNLTGKAGQYIRFVEQRFRDAEVQEKARACRRELGLTS